MFEGVEVIGATGHLDAYRWSEVIITHLDFTQYSIIMAHAAKRPIVHIVHNDIEYNSIQNAFGNTFIIYNSEWIAKKLNYRWPSITFPPPCDIDHYKVCENPEQNEYITLISLNKNKGADMFYKIVEAMPEKKFLGVAGSYDAQIIRTLPNLEVIPNSPDILSTYKRTRILLMPSAYESWGMTATEAMCNGIPVICTPTPGLLENCAVAGIFVGKPLTNPDPGEPAVTRGKVGEWVAAIKRLDDKAEYGKISQLCKGRAKELKPDFEKVENFLFSTQ